MSRYLINFSYIGTNYSGVARVKNTQNTVPTVQEILEDAIHKLKPKNNIELKLSSRTDSGVHAINSTAHFDLEIPWDESLVPMRITRKLNRTLTRWNESIRIIQTSKVSNEFSAQHNAIMRSYLYRLAVARKTTSLSKKQFRFSAFIPIEEINRCHFIPNHNFNIERAKEAATLLEGTHDFRTFMNVSNEDRTLHPFFARRTLNSITFSPGKTIVTQDNYERTIDEYEFWDITFSSRSFVYRQVRRLVGALIAVAEGQISKKNIYEMLTIPSKHSWRTIIDIAPPHGLYLINVQYPPELLKN